MVVYYAGNSTFGTLTVQVAEVGGMVGGSAHSGQLVEIQVTYGFGHAFLTIISYKSLTGGAVGGVQLDDRFNINNTNLTYGFGTKII